MSIFLLSIGCLLYFGPDFFADKSHTFVLGIKIGWLGIIGVALLAPLQSFRDFVIVSDEGLMKSNLFGRKTRLAWPEISHLQIKPDENDVILRNDAKTKIKMSLCYNGWQDFLEFSAKHLNHGIHLQIATTLAGMNKGKPFGREETQRTHG